MLFGASFVDSSEDVEELSSDWGVAGVRDSGEILSEGLCVSMDGSIEKVAFELLVGWAVDADAGMPFGFAAALGGDRASSVGDGVAFKADRVSAAIADLVSLLLFECVVSLGGQ